MKIAYLGPSRCYEASRIKEEAEKQGHQVVFIAHNHLNIVADKIISIEYDGQPFDFGAVYYGGPIVNRNEWSAISEILDQRGIKVVNKRNFTMPKSRFSFLAEVIQFTQNGIPIPKSTFFNSKKAIVSAMKHHEFPVVVRTNSSHQGKGVGLAHSLKDIVHFVNNHKADGYFLRKFIDSGGSGDIRIFTVGYTPVAAMRRLPSPDGFRNNISQGGKGELFSLKDNPKIAELSSRVSMMRQLEVCGVDIIMDKRGNPYVLEANLCPQFQGLEKATGENVAKAIVDFLTINL